ncbi:sodium/glutamate symporter [Acuticoccus kandeliae]|uniref:sodium/glutamate symporter n=1 Tax=Acuticoccus kandeliae TaxID=2073160 RepID=UPI000D3E09C2|nr:sodium/glutamate symporter [Acuticoccus kandeliae]
MIVDSNLIHIDALMAFTAGIVVYFIGAKLTRSVGFLREYNIPEPVSGGFLVAILTLLVFWVSGRQVVFDLAARDALLIYFFTIVGLNARLSDLARGGRPFLILLCLTIVLVVLQNVVGTAVALLGGLPPQAGILLGSASFIGGHGTAIAWGPTIAERFGVAGAAELGTAVATLGLISASMLGGPVAKFLIERNRLEPATEGAGVFIVPEDAGPAQKTFDHVDVMRTLLAVHLAIFIGLAVHDLIEAAGLKMPLFVPCLLAGILLTNTVPFVFKNVGWPSRTPATAMVSDFSLSVFLAMSLMSMQLWTLAGSAFVLIATLVAQVAIVGAFIFLVFFRLMGRDYFAAVLSAGFAGFTLGATPTAIANMGAVTKRYGPSPLAFIVLPLVSAFFVDIINAVVIQAFLTL